jgi:hypothetical protein
MFSLNVVWLNVCGRWPEIRGVHDFESMARIWLRGNKFDAVKVFNTAILWTIWKVRNELCFQGGSWSRIEVLFGRCSRLLRNWKMMSRVEEAAKLELWAQMLEEKGASPARLGRSTPESPGPDLGAGMDHRMNYVQSVIGLESD